MIMSAVAPLRRFDDREENEAVVIMSAGALSRRFDGKEENEYDERI
jgi:hypothetical protein